jgi:hypothetical protein
MAAAAGAGAPQLIGVPPTPGAPKGKAVSAPQSQPIIQPNLGLFLDQPSFTINPKGLEDCLNIRIKKGRITSFGMGWTKFSTQVLNGPVCLTQQFLKGDGTSVLVVGTLTDLYQWTGTKFVYITPIYATGTVTTNGTTNAVVGVGTQFVTTGKLKAGDGFFFGSATQTDPTAGAWYTVNTVTDDTHLTLTTVPPANAGVAYTARKVFVTGSLTNAWHVAIFPRADVHGDGSLFEDLMYFTNNGQDYPLYWTPTAAQAVSQSSFGFKCRNLVRYKNMMIYLGIISDSAGFLQGSFINSDVGRPNAVVAGASSLAGQFQAAPGTAPLKTAVQLGDDLMIYTNQEIIDCSFVGAPQIFAFRTVIPSKGVVGDRLVAAFPDYHHFLGPDTLYWFNGVQATPVDNQVWRAVAKASDPNRVDCSFVTFDYANGDLDWAICLTTDANASNGGPPDFCYTANFLEGPGNLAQPYLFSVHPFPYTKRNFQFCSAGSWPSALASTTWATAIGAWNAQNTFWNSQTFLAELPLLLVGGNNGVVYQLGGDTQDGTGYQSFALFPRRVISDLRHRSLVKRVYPMVLGIPGAPYNMNITTTVFEQANQASSQGNAMTNTFDMTMSQPWVQWVNPYIRGRFMQVKFETDGSTLGQPWELEGYDIDVVTGGMH